MIRLEYPKFNIEGLRDSEKLSTIKKQLDTLTNNIQLVLESISGDVETLSEFVGNNNEAENSENISTITESITSITETIGELEGRDYIVEQGTSGIWTYRKWNSGIIELWGAQSFSCRQGWDANDLFVDYPFSIQSIISSDVNQVDSRVEICFLNTATTTNIKLNVKATAAATYAFSFRLVGRWK